MEYHGAIGDSPNVDPYSVEGMLNNKELTKNEASKLISDEWMKILGKKATNSEFIKTYTLGNLENYIPKTVTATWNPPVTIDANSLGTSTTTVKKFECALYKGGVLKKDKYMHYSSTPAAALDWWKDEEGGEICPYYITKCENDIYIYEAP